MQNNGILANTATTKWEYVQHNKTYLLIDDIIGHCNLARDSIEFTSIY
jgi:hypothetical protein